MNIVSDFAQQYNLIADLPLADKKRVFFALVQQNNPELEDLIALKQEVDALLAIAADKKENRYENQFQVRLKNLPQLAEKARNILLKGD